MKGIKMKTKPEITDEEIRGYMNFDKLITQHEAGEIRSKRSQIIKVASLALLLTGVSITYYFINSNQKKISLSTTTKVENPQQLIPEEKHEVVEDQSIAKKETESKKESKREIKKQENPIVNAIAPPSKDSTASAYVEAEPVAGFPHLYEYFNAELKYPVEAVKDSIQGIETVSFVMNAEGKPVDVKVIHSLGESFDKEAQRLIEQMPAWKPALMNGKPVKARISIPLNFRLEKIKK